MPLLVEMSGRTSTATPPTTACSSSASARRRFSAGRRARRASRCRKMSSTFPPLRLPSRRGTAPANGAGRWSWTIDRPGPTRCWPTLRTHASPRITDEDLKARGIDPATVRRYFLRKYGMTFQAFTRSRRLSAALEKMKQMRQRESAPWAKAVVRERIRLAQRVRRPSPGRLARSPVVEKNDTACSCPGCAARSAPLWPRRDRSRDLSPDSMMNGGWRPESPRSRSSSTRRSFPGSMA